MAKTKKVVETKKIYKLWVTIEEITQDAKTGKDLDYRNLKEHYGDDYDDIPMGVFNDPDEARKAMLKLENHFDKAKT